MESGKNYVISRITELDCDNYNTFNDRLCGLVVRIPGCKTRGQCSIPGATRFSEQQWVWNGIHSALVRVNEELLERKVAAPV
jgi:hypothetical protein